MNFRIASDLHLEAFTGRNFETLAIDFLPHDDRDKDSILVLAGDISSQPDQLYAFLKVLLPRFQYVLYVPGNHEYYRHNYQAYNAVIAERLATLGDKLMFSLDGMRCFELGGVRFVLGTLWADGGPTLADQGRVGFYLNDFRLIGWSESQRHFRVEDMIGLHKTAKAQLAGFLALPFDGKTVVITHHLPSRRCVSARFWPHDGSDGANGGFASNCDDILAGDHAPVLWIHGHTHDTIDMKLWETRIVCNPAGYRGEWFSKTTTFMQVGKDGPGTVPKFVEL